MTSPYLERLQSTVNQLQAKQLTRLVLKEKNAGNIKNLDELRGRIEDVTNRLLSEEIAPTFETFIGVAGELIDSETYNWMLERIRDDLETIFSQTNSLNEVIQGHHQLIANVILAALRKAVEELDAKVTTYELLARDNNGFNDSQFNTFRSMDGKRTFRTVAESPLLFSDPRTGSTIDTDITFDLSSQNILAGSRYDNQYIPIRDISQIFDNETDQSTVDVKLPNMSIRNIIDNTIGTYWMYSILSTSIKDTGVLVKLRCDLSSSLDLNFIEVEPASPFPMELVRIDYMDNNNVLGSINIESVVSSKKRIAFPKINTNLLILVFKQENQIDTQYTEKSDNVAFLQALQGTKTDVDVHSIASQLQQTLRSKTLLNAVLSLSSTLPSTKQKRFHNYVVGFDNIKIGYSNFSEKSIFVSNSLRVKDITQLGLVVEEQRPVSLGLDFGYTTETYPTLDSGEYFPCSIEYWVRLLNYNSATQLISVDNIPIIPIGINRIYHERLIVNTITPGEVTPNTGYLMFYPVYPTHDIKVYRDGFLLIEGTDWAIDTSLSNTDTPPNGTANRIAITIVSPKPASYYTASYTPARSNSRAHPSNFLDSSILQIVDLKGDASIKFGKENLIYLDSEQRKLNNIVNTDIYLSIILRRNTIFNDLTPIVDEYNLLTSIVDSNKFND